MSNTRTLIIYAHPYRGSFNHAILVAETNYLKTENKNFDVIDLYKDHFNPCYSTKELALYSQGRTLDPLVKKYQGLLKQATNVIFIFPIWWNSVPAIVKGFIDKVMKKYFAFDTKLTGMKPEIKNVQNTYVITTSVAPKWYLEHICGNAIKKVFMNSTLKQIGFKHRKWIEFGNIKRSSLKKRELFISKINKYGIKGIE